MRPSRVHRGRAGASLCAVLIVALLTGCSSSAKAPQPTAGSAGGTSTPKTTTSPATKVNVDTTLACNLLSSADVAAATGRSFAHHSADTLPVPDGTVNTCVYSDSADAAKPGTGVIFGTGQFTAGAQALLRHLTAKGYQDVSADFGVPAGYRARGNLATVQAALDVKHSVIVLCELPGAPLDANRLSCYALMRALLTHLH